jgi:hypothetical protein
MRLLAISLLLLSTQPAAALDILTCGAVVPRGEVGVLQNDLTCSGEYAAVSLESGASVDLNGHAIHGPATKGVICLGTRCAVTRGVRGGEITGTITGNYPPLALDVWAKSVPRLSGVASGRSQRIGAPIGDDLGVCAGD